MPSICISRVFFFFYNVQQEVEMRLQQSKYKAKRLLNITLKKYSLINFNLFLISVRYVLEILLIIYFFFKLINLTVFFISSACGLFWVWHHNSLAFLFELQKKQQPSVSCFSFPPHYAILMSNLFCTPHYKIHLHNL